MAEKKQFTTADYAVFIGMLVFAVFIGVYYAIKDRKKKSVENYYFGQRTMSPIPVGASIALTFVSSTAILAYPAYAYMYGTVIIWFGISTLFQMVFAYQYYIPLYQRLQIGSVYEYLELRFHQLLRRISSFILTLLMVIVMGTSVYITGIALSAVAPLSINTGIITTSIICTLYTTIGGIKAVVWTDTMQAVILMAGSIAVLIKTTLLVGGMDEVWTAIERGGRNTFWEFNPDPTIRHTAWTIFVGSGVAWISAMCTTQAIIQRYVSCKNVKDARIACIVSSIPVCLIFIISALNGCVMYAFYEGCDPVMDGKVQKVDQMMSYLVLDIFQYTPGMAGLFVSAAFSGMLSTVSSGINSVAVVVLKDFIVPLRPQTNETLRLLISKCLSVVCGVIIAALAILTQFLGAAIIHILFSLAGICMGPILGLFTGGIFFPWTNTIGATIGLISGILITLWATLGAMFLNSGNISHKLPFSVDKCSITSENVTKVFNNVSTTIIEIFHDNPNTLESTTYKCIGCDTTITQSSAEINSFYSISYLYMTLLGFIVCLIIALVVSFLTGAKDPKTLDPLLFLPLVDNKYLPPKIRKFFRFGVPEIGTHKQEENVDEMNSLEEMQNKEKLLETMT